ncbi:Large subunit ribosomal protein L13e [Heracleum sosnowskyi]|uniref:Large subunit ribosomal protein L13e n=1 Tax=Heracleum sosnowskyi TaxID=360622 RepID=A0AAD8I6L0_9APIA|nr:Large subunit ribosomal protein L13e [Heracleum sosnowskyi]
MKHNNVIPNGHFKKHWQNYIKTWFNQPARKTRRRNARQKKAVKTFPRPTAGPLRPIVHDQTLKYNMKVRVGRGFSLEELKPGFEAFVLDFHIRKNVNSSPDDRKKRLLKSQISLTEERRKRNITLLVEEVMAELEFVT